MSRDQQVKRNIFENFALQLPEKHRRTWRRLLSVRCRSVTYLLNVPMNVGAVSIPRNESIACPRCGTLWRLKGGLCVSCLLLCGLEGEMHDGQTLDDVLNQIDMSDAD